MIDPKKLEQFVQQVEAVLPQGIANVRVDASKNLRVVIASVLSKMDMVTREEFDIQQAVLLRTREKLEALEDRVNALETAGLPGTLDEKHKTPPHDPNTNPKTQQ